MAPALRMTHVTKASYKFFFLESSLFNSGHSLLCGHIHQCFALVNKISFFALLLSIISELVDNTCTLRSCHIYCLIMIATIVRTTVDLASLQKTTNCCCWIDLIEVQSRHERTTQHPRNTLGQLLLTSIHVSCRSREGQIKYM